MNTYISVYLYKAFSPVEALDIAEVELSLFIRQCLNRRIPDLETLRRAAIA